MKSKFQYSGLLLLLVVLPWLNIFGQTGTVSGNVVDKTTNDPIPFVNIILRIPDKNQVGGTTSDREGKYTITKLAPGKYNLLATFLGYKRVEIKNIEVFHDSVTQIDIRMEEDSSIYIEGVGVKSVGISREKKSIGYATTVSDNANVSDNVIVANYSTALNNATVSENEAVVKAEPKTHISFSNYSSGIYFIGFTFEGRNVTGKVILN